MNNELKDWLYTFYYRYIRRRSREQSEETSKQKVASNTDNIDEYAKYSEYENFSDTGYKDDDFLEDCINSANMGGYYDMIDNVIDKESADLEYSCDYMDSTSESYDNSYSSDDCDSSDD